MSKKTPKVALPTVFTSAEAWLYAALALISKTISDQTAPAEGTTPNGKGKPALTVPPMFVSYGFPSSQAFADLKISEGVRFAKKRGDLWEPNAVGIGRQRLVDAPVTTKTVDKAERASDKEKRNVTIGEIVNGPRLLDSAGKQDTRWMLFLSPRLGAGMAPGEREVTILATMLHYCTLAALGPAEVITYDPKKQPKAYANAPRGRQERYGARWKQHAAAIGFAQPEKKENFELTEGMTATLRAMVVGSEDFPEPLGALPAPVVSGFTLKRIGSDIRDFSRQRTFVCPLYDKKDKETQHSTFLASARYAPDSVDEVTGLVTTTVADFAPKCGKADCGKTLTAIQPPPLRLYNEAIKRGLPVNRALLIASGEIAPPWAGEKGADEKDAATEAQTPAEEAEAVGL